MIHCREGGLKWLACNNISFVVIEKLQEVDKEHELLDGHETFEKLGPLLFVSGTGAVFSAADEVKFKADLVDVSDLSWLKQVQDLLLLEECQEIAHAWQALFVLRQCGVADL